MTTGSNFVKALLLIVFQHRRQAELEHHQRTVDYLTGWCGMTRAQAEGAIEDARCQVERDPPQPLRHGRSLLDALRDGWDEPPEVPGQRSLFDVPAWEDDAVSSARGDARPPVDTYWDEGPNHYVRDAHGHEHDARGRFTGPGRDSPSPATKPGGKQPVKPVAKPAPPKSSPPAPAVFAAREQRHAEAQQSKIADAIDEGAESIDGSAPADVERVEKGGALTCLEVKTKLKGKAVRMSAAAQARKALRLQDHEAAAGTPAVFHTVAVDHRSAYRTDPDLAAAPTFPCHYKRGCGNYSLSEMELVHTPERLNRLMAMADADLPDKARPTTSGWWGPVLCYS
jgi:hypothetical protein